MDALKEWLKPEVMWFAVGVVLLLLEFAMPGLIVFFFGVGAIIVGIVCLATDVSLNVQLVIFLASSVASLLLLRKAVTVVFAGHIAGRQSGRENLDEFVGQKARVIRKITPDGGGKVELHGVGWEAEADVEIPEDAVVEVLDKKNITLKVKRM